MPLLSRLTSSEAIPYEAPFWALLFEAFDFVSSSGSPATADVLPTLQKHGLRFFGANLQSGNLQRLSLLACESLLRCAVKVKLAPPDAETRKEQEREFEECVLRVQVCRIFLQYFIEHLKQDVLSLHLSGWPDELPAAMFDLPEVGKGVPRALMKSLVTFLVGVKVTDFSYGMYEEALALLLVLFAAQMFNASVHDPSLFLDMMLEEGEYFGAKSFVQKMFHNIESRRTRPLRDSEKPLSLSTAPSRQPSLLSRLAGLGSAVFLLPIRAIEWFLHASTPEGAPVIANHSALLLLLIGNSRKSSHFSDAFTLVHDPQQSAAIGAPLPAHAFEEDFSRLFEAFSARLDHDPHVLLFYFMLHRNVFFKQFIQSRTDLDVLLLPLLRHLYLVTGRDTINPQQVYMILIILLMLSQQEEFGANCERLRLAEVSFYTEHVLRDVSLADLIAIVLVRVVTLNLSRLQDGYLHTNCLAVLANLSSSFSHLHFYSAQRLFGLLLFLQKRLAQAQGLAVVGANTEDPVLHIVVDSRFGTPDEDVAGMTALYENLVSILLEVLQAIVVGHSVTRNTAFIYALLHARDHIESMASQDKWSSHMTVLMSLIRHFDPLMDDEPKTMEDVLATIERGVINWQAVGSSKGVLKFTYTEEANASESFFLPYTLSLVFSHSGTRFDHARITMFARDDWNDAPEETIDPLSLTIDT